MSKSKSKVFWGLLTAVLGALCITTVIRRSGLSLGELWERMRTADPLWLTLAALCALGMIYFEGRAVLSILGSIGYKRSERQGFIYACGDVFFSAITPSATGGQPASAFFMIRDGIPASVCTAVLLANLIAYNAAILTVGFLCLIIYPGLFLHFQFICKCLIAAGIAVLTGLGIAFIMLLRHPKPLYIVSMKLISLLHKIRLVKDEDKWKQKLEAAMEEYAGVVNVMAGKKILWVKAYVNNLLIRLCQFCVTVFAFMAIGGKGNMPKLWATQCYVSLGSNCIPIPGAVGVSDYLMLDGYLNMMDQAQAYTLQILARGLAFYCTVIVSALFVLAAYFFCGGKKQPAS